MDILPFSLFNVNFKEYQMKYFYSLIPVLNLQRSFGCLKIFLKQRQDLVIFFGLIEKQVSGNKLISLV